MHDMFNGQPSLLNTAIGTMYTLKPQAIELMQTNDPRIQQMTMGVGPPWEYVKEVSRYERRGRRPRPLPGP